jgi:hypothetical protein
MHTDWTVGSGDFVSKPVGLVTASSQGEKGHAAFLLARAKLDKDGQHKGQFAFGVAKAGFKIWRMRL